MVVPSAQIPNMNLPKVTSNALVVYDDGTDGSGTTHSTTKTATATATTTSSAVIKDDGDDIWNHIDDWGSPTYGYTQNASANTSTRSTVALYNPNNNGTNYNSPSTSGFVGLSNQVWNFCPSHKSQQVEYELPLHFYFIPDHLILYAYFALPYRIPIVFFNTDIPFFLKIFCITIL